jgi:hypothetical protein
MIPAVAVFDSAGSVRLQAYEIPENEAWRVPALIREHHSPSDLPMLLLRMPAGYVKSPPSNQTSVHPWPDQACHLVEGQHCAARPGERGAPGDSGAAPAAERMAVLVPCRTALRGRFPLSGTYFQLNEVFLDDHSLQDSVLARPHLPQPASPGRVWHITCHAPSAGHAPHDI